MKKLICALAAALVSSGALAQQGTIKFLVGFPAGASLDVMTRMVADKMQAALHEPDVRQRPDNYGMEPTGLPPAELTRIHRRDYEQWGPVIKASGFKPGS